MWIFTRYGFFSIACATKAGGMIDVDTVMVRARLHEHLLSLQERFPETDLGKAKIQSSELTDYRYRIVLLKGAWVAILTELAGEQTWSNFKNEASRFSCAKKRAYAYVDALHSVWDIMPAYRYGKPRRLKVADIKDMVYDPEPLDENDPEVQEEMFAQYRYQGLELEDLPRMSEKLRKKYAEYLKSPSE